jgi:hypothetical protein
MAVFDLLIYNSNNWMDELSEIELSEKMKNPEFVEEYNKPRAKKGDIVQIENGGFFDEGGYRKDKYAVIKVDLGEITLREAKRTYALPSMDLTFDGANPRAVIKKIRRYGLDIDSISLDDNKKATISRIQDKIIDRDAVVIN